MFVVLCLLYDNFQLRADYYVVKLFLFFCRFTIDIIVALAILLIGFMSGLTLGVI